MMQKMALVLLLVSIPTATVAQEPPDAERIAMARALFEQGLEQGTSEAWPEAIELFRRSVALYPSPQAIFNLAYALAQTGQHVEAAERYEHVVASASAPAELRTQARARAAETRELTARLTVELTGETDHVTVQVGPLRLPPAALGVPIPVDTGPRDLQVLREERAVVTRHFDLRAGQSLSLSISVPGDPGLAEEPWLWVLVGVVVAGAAVGTALGVALSGTEPTHMGNVGPGVLSLP